MSSIAQKHYTLEPLGDGVYAAIHVHGGSAICNAGLIDLSDSSMIIDPFLTPTAAEALRADALRLTGRVPRWVINTHYHNDHIWGNQAFLPEADIISTVETRALIQSAGKDEYEEFRLITSERLKNALAQKEAAGTDAQRAACDLWVGYFSGLERDLPRLRVVLPSLAFEGRMVLHGSRRRVQLIAFSGAHTASDVVVYLPDDGVVFMSDLLFVGSHPYLGDGNADLLLEVLRSILDSMFGIRNVNYYVPGHGPIGTRADVEKLVNYIQDCQQIARRLAGEGETGLAEIDSIPIPESFAGWIMPSYFYSNLRFLVKEYQVTGKG